MDVNEGMLNLLVEESANIERVTLIVSIISLGISSLFSIVTIINTILVSKIDRKQQGYREIIAKQRIKDYNDIRNYLAMLLKSIDQLIDQKCDFVDFDNAYLNLMCQFKPQYDEDVEIIHALSDLKIMISKMYRDKIIIEKQDEINCACTGLKNMILAYCGANWNCIKQELGNTKMKYANTKEYYKNILMTIETKCGERKIKSEDNEQTAK